MADVVYEYYDGIHLIWSGDLPDWIPLSQGWICKEGFEELGGVRIWKGTTTGWTIDNIDCFIFWVGHFVQE